LTPKLCVVIPAYNASKTIHSVITDVMKYCPDVIVADDGSDDDTFDVAERAGAHCVRIDRNRGKGNALKRLFQMAAERGFDTVISIDADGQHDAGAIPAFIEEHKRHPDRILVGSRMKEKGNIPRARLNSMKIANFYSSLASNQLLEDTQCGFRLYPLSLIQNMHLTTERYVTETEVLIKTGDAGGRIGFIDIKAIYSSNGSHFRPVSDLAAITTYVIIYLHIKWIIEGVTWDRPNTYYQNNIIDRIGSSRNLYSMLQVITVFTGLPFTVLFLLEYILLFPFMNNFASVRTFSYGYFRISLATFMLPVTLVVMVINKIINIFGLEARLIDRFIELFYPEMK
jgi:glycosyltransferase involved in cell wall biosynthesis